MAACCFNLSITFFVCAGTYEPAGSSLGVCLLGRGLYVEYVYAEVIWHVVVAILASCVVWCLKFEGPAFETMLKMLSI